MTSRWTIGLVSMVVAAGLSATWMAGAAEKPTIKQIMKDFHKGDDALCKKVSKGQATPEELTKIVDAYAAMPGQKPAKGDQAAFDTKANALLAAAKALQKGEAGAAEAYKTAVNCKACHKDHKGD